MTWRDTFWTAMDAVRSHRLRSSLTMLGILIGITAVVLTVGIGQGAQATVRDQINELGTNLLVVSPGSSTSSTGMRGGFGTVTTLTQAGRRSPHLEGGRSRRRGRQPRVDDVRGAGQRIDRRELDDDPDRDDAELGDHPITRRRPRSLHLRHRPAERGAGRRARPRHRHPALREHRPDRELGDLQRRQAPGGRGAPEPELRGAGGEQRPRGRSARAPTRSASSAASAGTR